MSKWIEQREAFYKIAIARGMTKPEELKEAFPLGTEVPRERLTRWLARLTEVPKDFASQRRYVNRFKVGADPEFTFIARGTTSRKDAQAFSLKQGPAFGADNNGRLAEIRPHPSRSVVEVCASVLATLRWMAILHPQTTSYEWHAGAWSVEDGLGGHVHFGRKRPNRAREIAALDSIEETMLDLGLFDAVQQETRRGGDSHHQLYGRLGDFRLQAHGYEYRTFPSWLDSPELAFLTMTLAKLGVHDPSFVWPYKKGANNNNRLVNFLSYYKNSDDDARLASAMLKGRVFGRGGDFKPRWGISVLGMIGGQRPSVVPLSIKPSKEDTAEMFEYLLNQTPLKMRIPTPTWEPINPPRGYRMVIDSSQTIQRKGIGELCWDICCSEQMMLSIARENVPGHNRRRPVAIWRDLGRSIPNNIFAKHGISQEIIFIHPESLDQGRSGAIRQLLLSGALPLWRVKDVQPNSWDQWKAHGFLPKKKNLYCGEVIYGDGQLPGI